MKRSSLSCTRILSLSGGCMECLESRTLLSAALPSAAPPDAAPQPEVILTGRKLVMRGTPADDRLEVRARFGVLDIYVNDTRINRILARKVRTINLVGGDGDDFLVLSRGIHANARIDGGAGNDTLSSSNGRDLLLGRSGNDTLDGWLGADQILGGSGRDSVDYSLRRRDLVITLDGRADDGEEKERDNVAADIEVVTGGKGDDEITGNAGANRIDGGGGDDVLRGGAGNDTLIGGAGEDSIFGDDGLDEILARDDEMDTIFGGNGKDIAQADVRRGLWVNDRMTEVETLAQI